MSWYSSSLDSVKKLDSLIDSNPSLQELFNYPDFIQQLKAYNPKLLDFLTNSQDITKQLIQYLTIAPLESDTKDRKSKLPLMAIEMIQTEAVSVLNGFLKIDPVRKKAYFLVMFEELLEKESVIPLLCGYFFKFNIIMFNNKFKETIDLLYEDQTALELLSHHHYSPILMNCLQLYLNVDMTKTTTDIAERFNLRAKIVRNLCENIKKQYTLSNKQSTISTSESQLTIENVSEVLNQIIDKYYMIADGKSMLDIILAEQNVDIFVKILMQGNAISLSIVNLICWIIRYYSLSSFNIEERQNQEMSKKNIERLEQQPFIKKFILIFPQLVDILRKSNRITIFHSKLIEILNMSLALSSMKIFMAVKTTKYLEVLIEMLFKFEQQSIVHRQIDKLFLTIFTTDRLIYELYKHYLFCEADLIEMTAGRYFKTIANLEEYKHKINKVHQGYFGILTKIIKIYSKIQTADEEINLSIMSKSALWEQITNNVLKPYDLICFKDLGSYDASLQNSVLPTQFTTKLYSVISLQENDLKTKQIIEEINRQESLQNIKTMEDTNHFEKHINQKTINQNEVIVKIAEDDTLFNVNLAISTDSNEKILDTSKNQELGSPKNQELGSPKNQGKSGFQEYLQKHKVEAEKQIKLRRSESQEKKLSAQKTRVTSPSPKRVNKWQEKVTQQNANVEKVQLTKASGVEGVKKQKISITQTNSKHPLLPPASKKFHPDEKLNQSIGSIEEKSTISKSQLNIPNTEQPNTQISKSLIFDNKLYVLRKAHHPNHKKDYRPVNSEDQPLFDLLGLKF